MHEWHCNLTWGLMSEFCLSLGLMANTGVFNPKPLWHSSNPSLGCNPLIHFGDLDEMGTCSQVMVPLRVHVCLASNQTPTKVWTDGVDFDGLRVAEVYDHVQACMLAVNFSHFSVQKGNWIFTMVGTSPPHTHTPTTCTCRSVTEKLVAWWDT